MLVLGNMLTNKKELAIQYHLEGATQTEAVFKAYDCKDEHSAGAFATKLFKQEEVRKRLGEKQSLLDARTIDNIISFQDQVKQAIPCSKVIEKLKTGLESGDARTVDSTIDKYIKIIGGYNTRDSKAVGMFNDL